MTEDSRQLTTSCPHCGRPVDPLRTGAVSIVGGRIVHFCSATCREAHLRGVGEPPLPEPVIDGPVGTTPEATEEPAASPKAGARRSGTGMPPTGSGSAWRNTRPQLLEVAALLVALGTLLFVPGNLLAGYVPLGTAAVAVLLGFVLAVAGQRRSGAARIFEAAAIPLAGAGLLVAGAVGIGGGKAAICAVALLLVWRTGRLTETLGRIRSGVLDAMLDEEARVLAREWRDNSLRAERIRRVTLVLEWIRVPAAAGLAASLWWFGGLPADRAIVAGAILLVAVDPRVLRMVTGDAHLGVALAASRRGLAIRDAHAVEQAGTARLALFISPRCLLEPQMSVVDWRVAPGADEQRSLAALAAVETDVPGRVGEAVRGFLDDRGATAPPADVRDLRPGLGVAGRDEAGRILCGSRALMLEELVSTATHEDWAAEIERTGRRVVFLAVEGRVVASFALEERPLPNVSEDIRQLAAQGVEPAMTSGAESEPAQALGARLGIDDVRFDTPEERLDQALAAFTEAGDRVLLVGHGPAFEESFRSAAAAVCCGGGGPGMAGIDVRAGGLGEVVWVVRAARDAARSVVLNSVAAGASLILGLWLAAGWQFPESAPVAGALGAAAAAFTTWNGPYPAMARLRQRTSETWRRLRRLAGLARFSAR